MESPTLALFCYGEVLPTLHTRGRISRSFDTGSVSRGRMQGVLWLAYRGRSTIAFYFLPNHGEKLLSVSMRVSWHTYFLQRSLNSNQ